MVKRTLIRYQLEQALLFLCDVECGHCVDNLRNSPLQRAPWVLGAILALNLKILDHNLLAQNKQRLLKLLSGQG
jgi:hypothetical protein